MSKVEKFARIIIKRSSLSGVTATIAPSDDHTILVPAWSTSDVYVGEFLLNEPDQKLWIRTNDTTIRRVLLDGDAGTSGTSGTSGKSGTSGTSGTNGGVTSGTNGTSGTSGTSGTNGTSGTSGTNGTSGTSGTNGTSGTSGTVTRSMTYTQLVAVIGASTLNQGESITITDFQTTHYLCNNNGVILDPITELSEPVINTGTVERLIVKASSNNTLYPEVYSIDFPDDVMLWDWNPVNWLQDIGFSTDQETIIPNFKGVIYQRHDVKRNNLLGYDFRTVKFRRWKKNYPGWDAETTYAKGDKVQVAADGCYLSLVEDNLNNLVSDAVNWQKIIDYAKSEYWEYNDISAQDVSDYQDYLTFVEFGMPYERACKNNVFTPFKDTQDEFWGNIGGILSNNVFFLSSDDSYSMFSNSFGQWFEFNTCGEYFDGNVFGTYNSSNTFGNDNFFNTFGDYNSFNTFVNDNSFNTFGNNNYSNTFVNDNSTNTFGNVNYNNTFGNNNSSNTFGNVNYNNTFGNNNSSNTFGNGNSSNTFGNDNYSNTFGNGNYSNIFGNNNYSNTFGDYNSSTFGNKNYSNTFGDYNSSTFGNGNSYNTFGNVNSYNIFGNKNSSNTFGNNNSSNTFGNVNYSNTFGNGNYSNTFGDGNSSNTFGNGNYSNTFGNGNSSNTFGSLNKSNVFTGIVIVKNSFDAVNGTGVDYSLATHLVGDYPTQSTKTSTGTFKLKYLDGSDNTEKIVAINA